MNGNGDALLATEHVTKAFGGLVAVEDVSFTVKPRSIVSIIGPNGAGKTTFFNMLTGLYKPTIGRIQFDGKDVTGTRPDIITKLGVARTFQNIRLFSSMTAIENVMVGQHARMSAGLFGSILRPPAVRKRGGGGSREGARDARLRRPAPRASSSGSRATSPTATSGAWRSRGRSRPTRRCCCSTSRPPA